MLKLNILRLRHCLPRNLGTSATLNPQDVIHSGRSQQHEWKGLGDNYKNFIGGEFVQSKSSEWHDVLDPVTMVASLFQLG
jgi:malonate-semialdehyde dehydrogenase (acetylating)/methylmalonate-semialdehyde dehydrogenase